MEIKISKFKDMCPRCRSENFEMIGSKKYSWFRCNDCTSEFNHFLSEEVKNTASLNKAKCEVEV